MVAEDAVGSDPGRLLSEAVAGGLLITEGVLGCSVTEIGSDAGTGADRYRTPVYAGEAAIALGHVQYAAGRGPCLTAIRDGQSHLTGDPAELSRSLPGWREQAARPGVSDTEAFTRLAQRSGREGRGILAVARDVLASAGRPVGQEPPA